MAAALKIPDTSYNKRVLVIEDDRDFADSLCTILESDGYSVQHAVNTKFALGILKSFDPEVVLSDIRLGTESGTQLVSKLLELKPNLFVIMMTAFSSVDTAIEAIRSGVYDYLRKPFNPQDLLSTLERLFDHIEVIQLKEAAEKELEEYKDNLEQMVEERTRELEVMIKEMEAFSYSISHDLRSPLRAINGFSHALQEDYGDILDDTAQDYLDRVRKNSQKMEILIDKILELSQITRKDIFKQPINLSEIAAEVIEPLKKEYQNPQLSVDIQPNLTAEGDHYLIHLVLENLLANAFKYSSHETAPKIEFSCRPQDWKTVFYIKDNGVGFDMKYVSKIFDPFQRLHRAEDFPGIGIGLANVKRIIDRHGGEIWAESEEQKGTTIFFTL